MTKQARQHTSQEPARYSRKSALAALVLLAFIWGFAWVAMKVGVRYADPFTFAALRAVLSAVFLLTLLPVLRRPIRPRVLGWTVLLGLLQTTGFSGFVMWALVSGGAGKTSVLTYTMPFWLLLMAWAVLGEKVRGFHWVAVILALGGLVFILSPWKLHGVISSALAVCTGISWAASAVVAKLIHKRHRVDVFSLTAWQMVFGTLVLLVVAAVVPGPATQWTPQFIAILAFIAVVSSVLGWFLWFYVLERLPAWQASLSVLGIPVVASLTSRLQLDEAVAPLELAGMLLIGGGLALLSFLNWRAERRRRG